MKLMCSLSLVDMTEQRLESESLPGKVWKKSDVIGHRRIRWSRRRVKHC